MRDMSLEMDRQFVSVNITFSHLSAQHECTGLNEEKQAELFWHRSGSKCMKNLHNVFEIKTENNKKRNTSTASMQYLTR